MKRIRLILTSLLLIVTATAFGQNLSVSGIVTDESTGEAVAGATILLQGRSTVYTMTDDLGMYKISVPSDGVLVVTFLGYKNAEIPVNGRTKIDIALQTDVQYLEDVIVVAFGTSTKESFTGSAKVINDEKLSRSQVSNVTSALAGQVAGVQITSDNGAPGSSPKIRIRGISSVYAGNDPLIVVDGTPYDGDMNNIAPNDIESMTVLKDAASNALYGARGANGVIMITTKKAKQGTATVSFDAKYGVNTKALQEYVTLDDPRAYYEQHYKALYNYYTAQDGLGLNPAVAHMLANQNINSAPDGGTGYQIFDVPENQMLIGSNGKLNPNAIMGHVSGDFLVQPDDWSEYAYRKGVRQEYTLSVSGAENKLSYYSSLSYLDNQGITENSDHQRLSARLKADYQAKDWMKVGANMSYAKFNSNSLGNNGSSSSTANVWAYTSQMAPIYPLWIRNADGSIYKDANGIEMMDHGNGNISLGGIPGTARPFITDANPLLANKLNTNNAEGNAAVVQGYMDIDFLKDFTFTINGSANLDETRSNYVYNQYYGQFRTTGGTVEMYHTRQYAWNTQQLLNYNHLFGKHRVTALLGHEYYNRKYYELGAGKSKMFSDKNKELDGAVVDGQSASSYQTEYNNEGYFVRAQYDYAERFFASGSFRRDASSRFHPDSRWGNFWSAGAAWIMSKESWFDAPWVDEFKLKASYGSQGNDDIGAYRYVDVFSIVPSDGNVSTIFDSKGNQDITWETSANANAGFEFTLLNGAVSGSIDYFNRQTTDMLFPTPVAPSQGYRNIYKNVGDMLNQGVEGDFNFNIVNNKNVQWNVNLNVTYLKNKVVSLADNVKDSKVYDAEGNTYEGFTSDGFFIAEGVPMYTWYQYEFAGLDNNGKSLWYKNVTDESGKVTGRETTDVYSNATKYLTHSSTLAPVYGGFGTSLKAYGFDFAINFTYQLGGKQTDGTYRTMMYSPTASQSGYAYHADLLKAWTPENTSSNIPRFQYADSYSNAASTRFLTSASFLNLQNVNLGYTLPERITKKALISSLRLYVAAENVFYWSARQGFDPRQSFSTGADASFYSPMRTISGGITIKF